MGAQGYQLTGVRSSGLSLREVRGFVVYSFRG